MDNQISQNNVLDVENAEKATGYSQKKFKTVDILIFAACLILAFIFWCYALYVDDPIIEKGISVNFVLVDGADNEYVTPIAKRIVVYGPLSKLSTSSITVKVNRSEFDDYNTATKIKIAYPEGINSNTTHLELQLNKK